MRPHVWFVTIIAALFLSGGCSTVSVTSQFDPATDFSTLKTYQWVRSGDASDVLVDNPEARRLVEVSVNDALEAKGFALDDSGRADFYVTAYARLLDRVNETNSDSAGVGSRRRSPGDSLAAAVPYEGEATLTVDVLQKVDGTTKLIWRGQAEGTLTNVSMEKRQRRVELATRKILRNFPPVKQ